MKEKVFSDWYHQTRDITARAGFDAAWQHQQAKVEELQTLYTQQGINMLKLQKRVDKAIRFLVEAELYQSEPNIDLAVKALKGEGQ